MTAPKPSIFNANHDFKVKTKSCLTQLGLGGGGKMAPLRAFAKYLKNGHETLGLLRQLYRSSFKIKISHSLLPW